ncbi:probable carboxylesterase 2 [Amaranthus tricolor]|uniref:probable carboxylesterase 2 n=1 Tax=Amaranthus tricolor TaxID=29722 RepID=UPI00258D4DE4|nr:probable carboxylesterase 2 [Amaranthus tricolor]
MEEVMKAMAAINPEDIAQDYPPFLVIHKDGTVQRFFGTERVPPCVDADTGVESQDVVITPEEHGGVWVRLYKPNPKDNHMGRLPVLVYFHGGGFCVESAASPLYHNHLNSVSAKGNVIMVSVDYRLAPEYPLPTAYEDSWEALKWVENGGGNGYKWIQDYADLDRVYLGGDSAGANIAHHMAKRLGLRTEKGKLKLKGILLIHPYFWGSERIGSELQKRGKVEEGKGLAEKLWALVNPGSSGIDDPLINPGNDPELGCLGGEKVMVWVAEHDGLRDRGFYYKEMLVKSGCKAKVEVAETLGENHVFHLTNPGSPNVDPFMNQVIQFINSS